ncbi:hypothetical protein L2E82_51129 [Cichorium intybus]|nr:hypothetical protein L2E82_51129 [Cichorium intybus]
MIIASIFKQNGDGFEEIFHYAWSLFCMNERFLVLEGKFFQPAGNAALDKIVSGYQVRSVNGTAVVDELKGQHATLRYCIDQLTVIESSRTSLVSYLREALQEQVGCNLKLV